MKLKQLEQVVKAELEDNEMARKNDQCLIIGVLRRKGIDTSLSFEEMAIKGYLRQMESITRIRRRVQSKYPELRDKTVRRWRSELEEEFKEYAK